MIRHSRHLHSATFLLLLTLSACTLADPYVRATASDEDGFAPTALQSSAGTTFLYWPELTWREHATVQASSLFVFQPRFGNVPVLGSVEYIGATRSSAYDASFRVGNIEVVEVWFSTPVSLQAQHDVADDLKSYLERSTVIVPNDVEQVSYEAPRQSTYYTVISLPPPVRYVPIRYATFHLHFRPHSAFGRHQERVRRSHDVANRDYGGPGHGHAPAHSRDTDRRQASRSGRQDQPQSANNWPRIAEQKPQRPADRSQSAKRDQPSPASQHPSPGKKQPRATDTKQERNSDKAQERSQDRDDEEQVAQEDVRIGGNARLKVRRLMN